MIEDEKNVAKNSHSFQFPLIEFLGGFFSLLKIYFPKVPKNDYFTNVQAQVPQPNISLRLRFGKVIFGILGTPCKMQEDFFQTKHMKPQMLLLASLVV